MANLLLDERPLLVMPRLAVLVGLQESIFLQQLHYWLDRSTNVKNGEKWVYNSVVEWQEQFPFWSISTIRRIIKKLEDSNLVISDNFNKLVIDKTKWYRIDYEKLYKLECENDLVESTICQNRQSSGQIEQMECSKWVDDLSKLNRPLPKNTTENTTENTKHEKNSRKQVFDDDSDEMKLSLFFISEIRKNSEGFKQPNLLSWCDEFRKIIELDKRDKSEISKLIRWVQQDDFEKANVLSPVKLRKRYDSLKIKMLNPPKKFERESREKVPEWFGKSNDKPVKNKIDNPDIVAERERLINELRGGTVENENY